jgi:hypothetical protein
VRKNASRLLLVLVLVRALVDRWPVPTTINKYTQYIARL